jgi:NADH:ubiquinone oxidoreductase subunit F (NADH-binding)
MSVRERIAPPAAPRLLAGLRDDGRPLSLAAHGERHGPLPLDLSPAELRERVTASGVTGRGGAGFPTGAKLDAVLRAGKRPIVVANGAEGEPPSGKDKVLLAYAPHLVIDGALLVAHAVSARQVVIATAPAARTSVKHALAERRREGRITVQTAVVPDRFIAGEETALVQFLNGGPALPTFTPPRPYERGVNGAPTLVLNVETLAHVALIARYGPMWFRSVGTPAEPGSALVTLSGAVRDPGVYEIELGSSLAALLEEGGATREAQAYLVGGYFGTWLSATDATKAVLSNAYLSRFGVSLGARAIVVLPQDVCGLVETSRVARYLADQSAGQCGPCVRGLAAIADSLDQLVRSREDAADDDVLRRRLAQVANRGACRHPDGAVALVGSALRVFGDELERHLNGDRCNGHGRPLVPIP